MHEDKIKLTLTKPALERLIGGDSEMEIKLRSSTAKEIVNKHFVPMLTSEVLRKVEGQVYNAVEDKLEAKLGKVSDITNPYRYPTRKIDFNNYTKELIKTQVDKLFKDKLYEVIDKKVEELSEKIEQHVLKVVTHKTMQTINRKVTEKLQEVLDKLKD